MPGACHFGRQADRYSGGLSVSNSIRIIPPLYIVALIMLGYGLQWLLPWSLQAESSWRTAGFLITVVSFCLYLWTVWTMKASGTTIDMRKPARTLLVHGPFRFSRNPMYLAALLLFAGLGLITNAVWFWLSGAVFQQILQHLIVPIEERQLAELFTDRYQNYRQQVRRWL